MEIIVRDSGVIIEDFGNINLPLTLDCGQAFRWNECGDGLWRGIQRGREVRVGKRGDGLVFYGADREEVCGLWADYFDLHRDYVAILKRLSADAIMAEMIEKNGCIRILNQEPWETLCSFIISSCNNISRIKLIISRLCEAFGERVRDEYTFPTAERLSGTDVGRLAPLRCGYRDKYIIDAARKCASGEVELESLRKMSMDDARAQLMKIDGVGRKVADCTLLFSLGFLDAFPVDVHVRRGVENIYPEGLPECTEGVSGLAQQYIFLADLKSDFRC